jgi:hypothetical protein
MVEGYSWCQTPGQPIITVTNGQFIYVMPHPDLLGFIVPSAWSCSNVFQQIENAIGFDPGLHS